MRLELEKLLDNTPYQLTLFDVDQDAVLLDLYDELVPVLFASRQAIDHSSTLADTAIHRGQKLCHYFLDSEKVKAFCNE